MSATRDESTAGFRLVDLEIQPDAGRIARGGDEIQVTPLTFKLFSALASRAPEVVSNQQLMDLVWPGTHISDESLKQRVYLLRRALGTRPDGGDYVECLRGWGYRLSAKPVPISNVRSGVHDDRVPGDPVERGLAHLERLEFGKAATLLGRATEDNPRQPRIWAYLAWARKWIGANDEAHEAITRAMDNLDRGSVVDRHFVQATPAGFNGELGAAIDHYELVLEESAGDTWSLVNLAGCDQLAGRLDEAESLIHKTVELQPENPSAIWSLGCFELLARLDLEAAESRLGPIRDAQPRFPNPLPALLPAFERWAASDLAEASQRMDEVRHAAADMPALGRIALMSFDARLNIAQGRINDGVSSLRRAMSLADSGEAWHGWVSLELALVLAENDAGTEADTETFRQPSRSTVRAFSPASQGGFSGPRNGVGSNALSTATASEAS